MKKKGIILLIVLVIVVTLGVGGYFLLNPDEKVSNQLSDRSKQFIQQEKMNSGSQWAQVNLNKDNTQQTIDTRVGINKCFSFVIRFQIANSRQEGDCDEYFAITNPTGKIVVYKRPGDFTDFNSVEGVSFRRQNSSTYTETQKTLNGHNFLIFTTKDGPWEANVFTYGSYRVVTLYILCSRPVITGYCNRKDRVRRIVPCIQSNMQLVIPIRAINQCGSWRSITLLYVY